MEVLLVPTHYNKQMRINFGCYATDKDTDDIQTLKTYAREWKIPTKEVKRQIAIFEEELAKFNHFEEF